MEATGYDHWRLAQFFYKNEVIVSVVNPLSEKLFIQMKLAKVKTDKSDAKAICGYAKINEVSLYKAFTEIQSECLQLFRLLDCYLKKQTATKSKKLSLIAVSNKLLKQCFAIAKSSRPYNENYVSVLRLK